MIVHKISLEKTRALYYEKDNDDFKVISLLGDAYYIKPGDEIEYEIKGVNFGWLVKPEAESLQEMEIGDANEQPKKNALMRHNQMSVNRNNAKRKRIVVI